MLYECTCNEETASCAHYRTFLKIQRTKGKEKDTSGGMASRAPA